MSSSSATETTGARGSNALLLLVCLAQFMVILDVSIVNVALPSIRADLHFSTTGLQWVVNAYTLTFSGFLLLGGRASDLLGRRRVFVAGIALFGVASVLCAGAGSQGLLLGSRALQGVGAAVISPASLAIITTSFEEGLERNRALGIWGAMAGFGGTSGVLFGGALTEGLGWWSIFLINAPVALGVILFAGRLVPEGRGRATRRHFDLAGAILVTSGLVAVVYGIVRTEAIGWGSAGVLLPLAAGIILILTFLRVEWRVARAPLVPLAIFRQPLLRAANLVVLLLGSALFAMWFFVSLYLQQVLHLSALHAGLAFLPMTLSIVVVSTLAARVIARIGARAALALGMSFAGAGLLLLSGVDPGGSYVSDVLPGGLLAAVGLGLSMVPVTVIGVQGVAREQSGLASGLINTSRLIGGSLGLAALSTLAASRTDTARGDGAARLQALTDGFGSAFLAGAVICAVGALAAAVLVRPERRKATAQAARSVA